MLSARSGSCARVAAISLRVSHLAESLPNRRLSASFGDPWRRFRPFERRIPPHSVGSWTFVEYSSSRSSVCPGAGRRRPPIRRNLDPEAARDLLTALAHLGEPSHTLIADEAGPCGFALARQLAEHACHCQVIAVSKSPRKPGERIKTDRRDALALARYLRSGDLTPVVIPRCPGRGHPFELLACPPARRARSTEGPPAAQGDAASPRSESACTPARPRWGADPRALTLARTRLRPPRRAMPSPSPPR